MELQSGLALPIHSSIEGFDPYNSDLNNHIRGSENIKYVKNKRSFDESFGDFSKPLPLLVWSGQPNEEDGRSEKKNRSIHTSNK